MTNESSSKLLESQSQLAAEELSLKKSLLQIEEQINILQIEQLNLIAMLKKSSEGSPKGKKCEFEDNDKKSEDLDLSVPLHLKVYVEEEEEEDEEDEDEDL